MCVFARLHSHKLFNEKVVRHIEENIWLINFVVLLLYLIKTTENFQLTNN